MRYRQQSQTNASRWIEARERMSTYTQFKFSNDIFRSFNVKSKVL